MKMSTENWAGRVPLMVAHCAGMLDLVALPVWIGTLIADYRFEPRQAGGLATLFLVGGVISSLFFAARFRRLNTRLSAACGFGLSAAAFAGAALADGYGVLAALHLFAGASTACGLSVTHGTIARSANPHRLFAIVGTALGVFAIFVLGLAPGLTARFGGSALFFGFSGVMAAAALVAATGFPAPPAPEAFRDRIEAPLSPSVWLGIAGVSCMAVTQAMIFSFLQRIGVDHGFSFEAVTGVLVTLGFVNLAPAPLAALMERRLPARGVMMAGPLVQAALAVTLAMGRGFPAYAGPAILFAAAIIFTLTFAFGAIARLDASSRSLAATPAMMMAGAALGPMLGGTLVQSFGYPALGVAAVVFSTAATILFSRMSVAPETALP